MTLSTLDLAQARQTVDALLEQLHIEAYLFEVEPRDTQWEIRLECAMANGWQTLSWAVDKTALLAGRQDARQQSELLAEWRQRLASCKIDGQDP